MILSSIKKAVFSRLSARLILVVVVIISAVSLILTLFFMSRQKRLLTDELISRASSLAHNLAYNTRDLLLFNDRSRLQSLVRGVAEEPDIETVFIIDIDGATIASTDTTFSERPFTIPEKNHPGDDVALLSATTPATQRLMIPVEIDAPLVDTSSPLLISSNESEIYKNIYQIGALQPNFNPNGDEILFTIFNESVNIGLASISIPDRTVRLLIESVSNGFWSTSGRYLSYNTGRPVQLSVLDTVTGHAQVIAIDEGNIYGTSCFTPDDRHIIATLPTSDGLHRLFRIPRDGGKAEQLTFHPGLHWFPNCSGDGKWIVYSDTFLQILYIYDIHEKISFRLFPDMEEAHWCGSFSPDGKQICYLRSVSNTTNDSDVFIADFPVDYTKPLSEQYGKRITESGNAKLYTDWSPDGSLITYGQRTRPQRFMDVWVVSPLGDKPPVNLTADVQTSRKCVGYVVLDIVMDNVNKAIARGNRVAFALYLIFTGMGVLCAIVLMRTIVRPVKMLADAAGKVAEGDLDHKVAISREDEIGMLADSFNRMTERLKTSINEIETHSRDLEKAYRDLESLDRTKDDFLSLVSHELRTPLGSMLLHAEMLLNKRVPTEEKQARYHQSIVNQCKRLTRLVNDVLDISKIEAGRMEFDIQPFLPRELLSDIYSMLLSSLRKKNLMFDYNAVPGDIRLMGDRDKVVEVLTNIVTNAIKFTPEGGSIGISLTTDGAMGTIAVSDTGIGIPETDIPKVFERFSQLDTIDHHSDGTGLGMAIAKSIVELHGGTIWIESIEGKGTTVFFTLPVAKRQEIPAGRDGSAVAQESGCAESSTTGPKPATILIVDDEQSYREAIADCVRSAGYECLEASSGNAALRLAEEAHPSLIILDVMMPDLSGIDVCRILREQPHTREIPVVMVSARGQAQEKEEGLRAGANGYITKPFDFDGLILVIDELIGGDEQDKIRR